MFIPLLAMGLVLSTQGVQAQTSSSDLIPLQATPSTVITPPASIVAPAAGHLTTDAVQLSPGAGQTGVGATNTSWHVTLTEGTIAAGPLGVSFGMHATWECDDGPRNTNSEPAIVEVYDSSGNLVTDFQASVYGTPPGVAYVGGSAGTVSIPAYTVSVTGTSYIEAGGDGTPGQAYLNGTGTFFSTAQGGLLVPGQTYTFKVEDWTEYNTLTNASSVTTMVDLYNLKALYPPFSPTLYALAINVVPSNGGTVTGAGTNYTSGVTANVKAIPNIGFAFLNWTTSTGTTNGYTPTGTIVTAPPNPSGSIVMNDSYTVAANFVAVASANYTLTTSAGPGGTVSPGGSYPAGSTAVVQAYNSSGYNFAGWTANSQPQGLSNPLSIVMNSNENVVASFAPVGATTYSLTVNTDGNGTVAGSQVGIISGASVAVSATANASYNFDHWSVDSPLGSLSSISNTPTTSAATATVGSGNMSITAHFSAVAPDSLIPPVQYTYVGQNATVSWVIPAIHTQYNTIYWTGTGPVPSSSSLSGTQTFGPFPSEGAFQVNLNYIQKHN